MYLPKLNTDPLILKDLQMKLKKKKKKNSSMGKCSWKKNFNFIKFKNLHHGFIMTGPSGSGSFGSFKTRRNESAKRHWIIFDGDVDPEWAENLNSVLDDNKLIILSNENLKYVTLTIIDRYDMVWFSEEVCTLEIIYTNYSETLKSMPLDYNEDVDSSVANEKESADI